MLVGTPSVRSKQDAVCGGVASGGNGRGALFTGVKEPGGAEERHPEAPLSPASKRRRVKAHSHKTALKDRKQTATDRVARAFRCVFLSVGSEALFVGGMPAAAAKAASRAELRCR